MHKFKYIKEMIDFDQDKMSSLDRAKLDVQSIQKEIQEYKSKKGSLQKLIEDSYDLENDSIDDSKLDKVTDLIGENKFLSKHKVIFLKNIELKRIQAKIDSLNEESRNTTDVDRKNIIRDEFNANNKKLNLVKKEISDGEKELNDFIRKQETNAKNYLRDLES